MTCVCDFSQGRWGIHNKDCAWVASQLPAKPAAAPADRTTDPLPGGQLCLGCGCSQNAPHLTHCVFDPKNAWNGGVPYAQSYPPIQGPVTPSKVFQANRYKFRTLPNGDIQIDLADRHSVKEALYGLVYGAKKK